MNDNRRIMLATLMPLFLLIILPISDIEASSPNRPAENEASTIKADANSPLNIVLQLKEADPETGISLRVSFENNGPDAISLDVCPAMLLCCVKGLHPLVTCEDTGVGLLDVCKVAKPTSHEVYLPIRSAFSFDLNIPPERLPAACLEKGRQVSVCLLYETEDAQSVRSNAVEAVMK